MVIVYVCPRCERTYKQRKYCLHHEPPVKCAAYEISPGGSGGSHTPSNTYSIHYCNACNGTGMGLIGGRCSGCKGKKKVNVPNPARKCGECNGTGMGTFLGSCNACRGTGWSGGQPL